MTSLCRSEGCVQTAGAAADNHNVFLCLCRLEICFSACQRVYQTGDGFALEHIGNTALQTTDTGVHQIQSACLCLIGHFGVCDALSAEGNQICSALCNHQLRKLGFCITTDCDNGNGNCALDFCDIICAEAAMNQAGSPHTFIMQMYGSGKVQSIYATFLLQIGGNCCGILCSLTALNVICCIDTAEDCQRIACFLTDIFDNQLRQTHTVFKGAAEFVHTLIGSCGDKCADQIAMCAMDFYGICACFFCSDCCITVAFNQAIKLFLCDGFGCFSATGGRDCTCCLQRVACDFCIAFGACVLQLDGNLRPCLMTGCDGCLKAADCAVIIQTGLSGAALCFFINNGCLECNQTKATLCSCAVIGCGAFAHGAVCVCEVIAHGRHNKAVCHCHGANLNGLEHSFKFHVFSSVSYSLFVFSFVLHFRFSFIYCYSTTVQVLTSEGFTRSAAIFGTKVWKYSVAR